MPAEFNMRGQALARWSLGSGRIYMLMPGWAGFFFLIMGR
jgi:uncharacterized membrane protein